MKAHSFPAVIDLSTNHVVDRKKFMEQSGWFRKTDPVAGGGHK